MKLKIILSTLNILIYCNLCVSQNNLNKLNFSYPLQVNYPLTGNFGEPRSKHFHTGLDYYTVEEGKAIVAVQEGYVSRILVSPYGYGLALYVDHPSGYTSVYGHLSRFDNSIAQWVEEQQYLRKNFSLDTLLPPDKFMVKQGEIIAYSGNSGQSAGPHLHFELRETASENPVNTLTSVYKITDNIPPDIMSVVIYPITRNSLVNQKNEKLLIKTTGKTGKFTVQKNGIYCSGQIGFGIEYTDRINNSANKFGVWQVKLFIDDSLYYHSRMDKIDFSLQNRKNSHFDYAYLVGEKRDVQRCWLEEGNDLKLYPAVKNRGLFIPDAGKNYHIRIELTDYNSNLSTVDFTIMGTENANSEYITNPRKDQLAIDAECRVEAGSDALFSHYEIPIAALGKNDLSAIYRIGDESIALKRKISISLYSEKISGDILHKTFMRCECNKSIRLLPVICEGNFFTAYSQEFGTFSLVADTTPPTIEPVTKFEKTNLSVQKQIKIKISDDLSGIHEYSLYIDDVWVLASYDAKNGVLSYTFDEHMPAGKEHTLKVSVLDRAKNFAESEFQFEYQK